MTSYQLPVVLNEHRACGPVKVSLSGPGRNWWAPVRVQVASELGVSSEDIEVASVVMGDRRSVSLNVASSTPSTELAAGKAEVVVQLRSGSNPVWKQRDQRIAALESSSSKQKQHIGLLRRAVGQLSKMVLAQQERVSKIALRSLMDGVRRKVYGGVPLTDEQKQGWNARVDAMGDAEREALGVSRKVLNLTKYGRHTVQGEAAMAAHEVPEEVAAAVTSKARGKGFHDAFQYVYGRNAEAAVFEDEGVDGWNEILARLGEDDVDEEEEQG